MAGICQKRKRNMDLIGLLNNILRTVVDIDSGRKGLTADGEEHDGRINYERGISGALITFQEAQAAADCYVLILAEMTFLQQELQFCNDQDPDAQSSLTKAIQSFEDALLALKAVDDTGYRIADMTYPRNKKSRYRTFPLDAFHQACISHCTRIQNALRTPGINMTEKAVLKQRIANMKTAQERYLEKQRTMLAVNDAQNTQGAHSPSGTSRESTGFTR